jgi:hypothetical protein
VYGRSVYHRKTPEISGKTGGNRAKIGPAAAAKTPPLLVAAAAKKKLDRRKDFFPARRN